MGVQFHFVGAKAVCHKEMGNHAPVGHPADDSTPYSKICGDAQRRNFLKNVGVVNELSCSLYPCNDHWCNVNS